MKQLDEYDWRKLEQTVLEGSCILVLGPGIARSPDAPDSPPLTSLLAQRLAADIPQPPPDQDDLATVAQSYVHTRGKDRRDLQLVAEDFYAEFEGATTPFHLDLASFPFKVCICLSPDQFMAEAFRQCGKRPLSAYYDLSRAGFKPDLDPPTSKEPLVYGLFGSAQRPASLLFSEMQILEFLETASRAGSGLPDLLGGELQDQRNDLLFVGLGFCDWYSRALLRVLGAYRYRYSSLAIESDRFLGHPDRASAMVFFETEGAIRFRHQPADGFAEALRTRFQALRPPSQASGRPPDAATPVVFLCHDSRDRNRVADLAEALSERGIAVWRDVQNLRVGDDWERQIPHVLNKVVNYVAICQTAKMATKGESYFHKEIEVALERQRKFPNNQGFVYPLMLESGAQLERLDHLHSLDVSTTSGVDQFARQLLENWEHDQAAKGSL